MSEPHAHHEEGGEHPQEIPGGNIQDQEEVRQAEGGPGDNLQGQEEMRQAEGGPRRKPTRSGRDEID